MLEKYKNWLGDKVWYKNWKVWLSVFIVFGIIGAFIDDEEPEAQADEPEIEEVAEVEEEKEDEKEEPEEEEPEEEEPKEETDLEEINKRIAEEIELSQDFALGNVDENGEPTDDGEPSEEFAWALFVRELTYDGDWLEMQTDNGFKELADDEKTMIANYAQNIANSVIGGIEDWEATDYQKRISLTVFVGNEVIGQSRITDNQEFKWNNI